MDYIVVKWLHILSSTILFGAGVGSAFHLFAASLRGHTPGAAGSARNVVLADWMMTTPAAIMQPFTGLWLIHRLHIPASTPWVAWSLALYAVAFGCWLPVVWIQLRLRDISAATAAASGRAPLPRAYWRLFAWWVGLGWVAFIAFVAIFWMMVARQVPFAL